MGRVQMPPHGNLISNIIGKIEQFITKPGYIISVGDFLQFSSDGNNVIVSPANNRFNAEAIALNDTVSTTGSTIIEAALYDDTENPVSFRRVREQIEQTKVISSDFITAGDFVHILEDGTIRRADNKTEIDGYALDSGRFAASIRIRTRL